MSLDENHNLALSLDLMVEEVINKLQSRDHSNKVYTGLQIRRAIHKEAGNYTTEGSEEIYVGAIIKVKNSEGKTKYTRNENFKFDNLKIELNTGPKYDTSKHILIVLEDDATTERNDQKYLSDNEFVKVCEDFGVDENTVMDEMSKTNKFLRMEEGWYVQDCDLDV